MITFLTIEDLLYFHLEEIRRTKGPENIRDKHQLKSCVEAPKASLDGKYLMNIFQMAATYVQSITINHPFIDGNKRVAAVSALVFLRMNGYSFYEDYEEQLADKILDFLNRKTDKEGLSEYFKSNTDMV